MWNPGINPRPSPFEGVNEEIAKLEGYLDTSQAHHELYRFLRANPTFAVDLLFGVKLFPFQHMAIKAVLEADYNLFIWARGCSKTYSCAIALMLYACLNQGVKIGLLSASFRQSRLIFQKMDDILNKKEAALGASCCTARRRAPDMWVYEFGESSITALPLGEGGKLRGFRFNMIVIDEFLLMPENIYNEVILPFLGVAQDPQKKAAMNRLEDKLIAQGKMDPKDKYQWPNNKLVMLSSASYKFEYLYKLYQTFEDLITEGKERDEYGEWVAPKDNASRCILHFAHDIVPEEIYDQNMINQSKSTMSAAQFDREFGAVFTDESDSYFKLSTIKTKCSPTDGVPTEIYGEKNAEYILSIDPSWSEAESSDDFAITVLKMIPDTDKAVAVHHYAMPGQKLSEHIVYFHYLLQNFNVKLIVFDKMGGVVFMNACNEHKLFVDSKINLKEIEVDFEDPLEYEKDLREFKNNYNREEWKICLQRNPSTTWIRQANELLQGNFDHARILFAHKPLDQDFERQRDSKIDIKNITFDRKKMRYDDKSPAAKLHDFIEVQFDNLEAMKVQCASIEVTSSSTGIQRFDLPKELKKTSGPGKARKDSYSSLVLGSWGHKIWVDIMSGRGKTVVATFIPMLL